MKKVIAITLMVVLIITSISVFAEGQNWHKSSDGVVEIMFVSLKERNYPKYTLELQARLSGDTQVKTLLTSYDLSSLVTSFVKNNPSYNNRKLKITSDGSFNSFRLESGTTYTATLNIKVAGESGHTLQFKIDLSDTFPDDFVNYDVINIASCIRAHVNLLLNSSSYSISAPSVVASKNYNDIVYYFYNITAQNRMGGNTTNRIVVFFNVSTGRYDSYNLTTNEDIVKGGSGIIWINAMRELTAIADYATPLSVDSIMAKVK